MRHTFSIVTSSPDETCCLGKCCAEIAVPGMLFCLYGDLGTGKTTFTRGFVSYFSPDRDVVKSPSFAIVNQYAVRIPITHIDCYRIDALDEFEAIGIDDFLFPQGITLVEWAEKIKPLLPQNRVDIVLSHQDETCRGCNIQSNDKSFVDKVRAQYE